MLAVIVLEYQVHIPAAEEEDLHQQVELEQVLVVRQAILVMAEQVIKPLYQLQER